MKGGSNMKKAKRFITSLSEIPLFVDVPYLCELLQLQPDTIRKRLQNGSIKATKIGKTWRISNEEVKRLYEGGVFP